jgi:hypothetical protein
MKGTRLVRDRQLALFSHSPLVSLVRPIEQPPTRTSNNNSARAVHGELLARGIIHRKGHQGKEDAPEGKGEEAALHSSSFLVDVVMVGRVQKRGGGMSVGTSADGVTVTRRAVRS